MATHQAQEQAAGDRTINFTCEAPAGVQAVCLAGDFNGWDPKPMARKNGSFRARVKLSPGEHQYRFVVDGEWRNDPTAQAEAPNPFGGMNSVIRV